MRRFSVKKAVSLTLALALALLLPGCGGEVSAWQETPVAPQTNESLSVFCLGDLADSMMLQAALDRYRQAYPDVEVELIKPAYDGSSFEVERELYQQVAAEIMSGEGPDVFIIDDTVMDVEKLVRQGVFADMEPFFQADHFDWEPYNQAVMDGGVWNGKRFVIPLSYDIPLLITSRTALEETGFDVDACGDLQGFLEETTRYMEDGTQTRELFVDTIRMLDIVEFSGVPVADYDTRTIDLSSPLLQPMLQWEKTAMEYDPNWMMTSAGGLNGAAAVRDGKALWAGSVVGALFDFYEDLAALKTIDETVMMPVRDVDGGIRAKIEMPVAVRANSENLQNAYNFLKILLSQDVQYLYDHQELSVLDSANEYFYQRFSQKQSWHILAGTNGFYSTDDPFRATDSPTAAEFREFVGYTKEITGTYYWSHLGLYGAMQEYMYEGADYDETLAEAQRQLERYITE